MHIPQSNISVSPACISPSLHLEPCRRLLVPLKRLSDLDAVLAYVLGSAGRALVRVFLLHVMAPPRGEPLDLPAQQALAAEDSGATALLAQAGKHCAAHALRHSSYILSGDVAFSILDAAEMLDCDEIVMARRTDWIGRIFASETTRKVERLSRHVPLVLLDADGAPVTSEEAAA